MVAVVGADNGTLPAKAVPFEALENIGAPLVEAARTDPDSPAIIAYTSGTTAAPKGVIHTHNTICAEANQLGGMNAGGDRPSLTGTPVGHFMGMQGGLQLPLRNGQPVPLIDVWNPARVLAIVAKHGLTAGSGSAYFLGSLLDHPDLTDDHMRHIRHVGLGGASIPAAFTEKATAAGVSVVRMYGSTEHPSITGSRHEDDARSRLHTDGRPLAGVEIKLLDDAGEPVSTGQPGEVWSRGPDLSVGYTDPALTAAFFDADGWYRTEDVGVLDATGRLTITELTTSPAPQPEKS
ncbi:AMP-binding protein [Frankia sp. AgPm24]|uniref:AMP-binding protein n=1 Tax=Frankia sp. AgPm24 TaxID=631128 RepID=UPI00200C12A8|nr:AMP-binding protein [Frankia sp. AgPm24]MCK9923941.1 AMP-binding protein [Frankia sp. AgPm24]